MASLNKIMLIGRLTRDPELKFLPNGTPQGELRPSSLGLSAPALPPQAPRVEAELPSWEENERRYWQAVLARTEGRIYGPGGAAEIAGIKPTTLRSRLVNLGLR